MKLLAKLIVAVGAVTSWVAAVYAICILAILFWLVSLTYFIIGPEDLPVGRERVMVAVGGPLLFVGMHFMIYAYLAVWARYDQIAWQVYGRHLAKIGLGIYSLVHLGAVTFIACDASAYFTYFAAYFLGPPIPASTLLTWILCYGFGAVVMAVKVQNRTLG